MAEQRLVGADRHPVHPDDELVRRWLCAQRAAKRGGTPLWGRAAETFCIGSTSAQEVCRRHGHNPDKMVKRA